MLLVITVLWMFTVFDIPDRCFTKESRVLPLFFTTHLWYKFAQMVLLLVFVLSLYKMFRWDEQVKTANLKVN